MTYGLKLPTGNNAYNPALVDSDSQIGSGSTDILLGAFHRQPLTGDNSGPGLSRRSWTFRADPEPVPAGRGARYGAPARRYGGWTVGNVQITPVLQAIVSLRGRDSGADAASPVASGYERLILSPGIEFDYKQFSFYADVEVPVLQNFNGDQLVAPFMVKALLAYNF